MIFRWTIVFSLVMLLSAPAFADEYVFNCRNYWTQNVLITLTANSVSEGRKLLKTDKKLMDKYSLEPGSQCAFRTALKSQGTPSKSTTQQPEAVTPTE